MKKKLLDWFDKATDWYLDKLDESKTLERWTYWIMMAADLAIVVVFLTWLIKNILLSIGNG